MTETRAVSIEDVRMLVGERQRYDEWLAALEARRADTPARVFERVHGDYSGRRSAVLEQLHGHVATLAALGDELDAKLSDVDAGLATLEDERAEAMLRTAVGEFDGDRWEVVRQDVEAQIAEISSERAALLAEVGDVRALLASARSEPAPSAPSQQATTSQEFGVEADRGTPSGGESDVAALDEDEDRTVDSEVLAVAAEMPSAISVQSSPEYAVQHDDEIASTTAREEADLDDALAMFAPSSTGDSPDEARRGALDGLEGIEAIDDSAPETSTDRTPYTRAATMTPASPAAVPAPAPASSPAAADADPFDDLAFLRSVTETSPGGSSQSARGATSAGTEPQKTLRCTECGTMNFPTEWYCERCGGELAAF